MLELAKGRLMVKDEELDANPWQLNTVTGTIDLQTGQLEKHNPRDLITKIVPVAYDPKAKCPTFMRFLGRVTGGDEALADYLQLAIGYTLTGKTTEQVFFFAYGKGRNGKSTLLNTVRDMLGPYGIHTPTETLLAKQYDNAIPVDLARLDGARMVTAIEANWNRQLDEAKIKAMTGGEPITARFMRQNLFQFVPVFKLWFVANDFPRVRATADAFWRRARVIPFTVEIPEDEIDRDLPEKLKAEWPGILAWAVRGCLKWQQNGLPEPEAVTRAVKDWQDGVDHVQRFVSEVLVPEPGNIISGSLMGRYYREWCGRNGEQPLPVARLKVRLLELDLTFKRTNRGSEWRGIKIRR
jgi:putative DNA primase/helicase